MARTRSRPKLLALLLIFAILDSARIARAEPFHSENHGYTITLPGDWRRIPQDVVTAHANAVQRDGTLVYDAGFQPVANTRDLEHPYLLVHVTPYSQLGLNEQLPESEFETYLKSTTGADAGKIFVTQTPKQLRKTMSEMNLGSPALDVPSRTFTVPIKFNMAKIGPVRAIGAGHFGKDAVVQLNFFSREADWEKYLPTFQAIADSFKFDKASEYVAKAPAIPNPAAIAPVAAVPSKLPAAAAPPKAAVKSAYAFPLFCFLFMIAVIGLIVFLIRRSSSASTR